MRRFWLYCENRIFLAHPKIWKKGQHNIFKVSAQSHRIISSSKASIENTAGKFWISFGPLSWSFHYDPSQPWELEDWLSVFQLFLSVEMQKERGGGEGRTASKEADGRRWDNTMEVQGPKIGLLLARGEGGIKPNEVMWVHHFWCLRVEILDLETDDYD